MIWGIEECGKQEKSVLWFNGNVWCLKFAWSKYMLTFRTLDEALAYRADMDCNYI